VSPINADLFNNRSHLHNLHNNEIMQTANYNPRGWDEAICAGDVDGSKTSFTFIRPAPLSTAPAEKD